MGEQDVRAGEESAGTAAGLREAEETAQLQEPEGTAQLQEPEETAQTQETGEDGEQEPLSPARAKAAIEAILFAMGEAVELSRIAAAVGLEKREAGALVCELMDEYEARGSGIAIIELDGSYQMCTRKDYYGTLIRLVQQPRKISLTDIMIETLSIIAYKQPVTRTEIEKIRGVKSDHAVNRLLEYGLVQEVGRLEAPGRPVLFGTTEEFLRHFGLSSLRDLPPVDPQQKESFRESAQEEVNVRLPV